MFRIFGRFNALFVKPHIRESEYKVTNKFQNGFKLFEYALSET